MINTLQFLSALADNNNREWFQTNKGWYQDCHAHFVDFSAEYLRRMAQLDETLACLQPKDCIWRIYRDVRFSHDKRPYKEWFGIFVATGLPGHPKTFGKKSMRGGYYIHIQPNACMFAGGIWDPGKELLKALRTEIDTNAEEVEQIMANPQWKRYFGDFDTEYMLKKAPIGFDPESKHIDWIKRKAYTFSYPLTDNEVCAPDFIDKIMALSEAAKPMNDFLNYTFELYGEFPSHCR